MKSDSETPKRPEAWYRLVFVDPREIVRYSASFKRRHSGTIQAGDWDLAAIDIGANRWVAACLAHWRDGVPWSETGIIAHDTHLARTRSYNRCHTAEDVVARYERLDAIFAEVKAEGRLKTAYELGASRNRERERDGVFVHFGRRGEPIFGGLGCHRLGMALVLGLERIPACLGVVHPEAEAQVLAPPLRQEPAAKRWRRRGDAPAWGSADPGRRPPSQEPMAPPLALRDHRGR